MALSNLISTSTFAVRALNGSEVGAGINLGVHSVWAAWHTQRERETQITSRNQTPTDDRAPK